MIRDWWNRQVAIKEVCGIEILIDSQGIPSCQYVVLRRSKEQVQLLRQAARLSLTEMLEEIKVFKCPLVMNVSGTAVLNKMVKKEDGMDPLNIAFPGIDPAKFYVQVIEQLGSSIVSIINRKLIDDLLEKFPKNQLVQLSLAAFAAFSIDTSSFSHEETFRFSHHHFTQHNGEISKYEFLKQIPEDEKILKWESLKVSERIFNAFIQSFGVFLYPEVRIAGLKEFESELPLHRRRLGNRFAGLLFILLIFVILLVNFFIWNQLQQKQEILQSQRSFTQSMVSNRDSLNHQIQRKEEQLKSLGILPLSHEQVILEIGKAVVPGIRLKQVNINPISEEDSLLYGQVNITGSFHSIANYVAFKKQLLKSNLKFKIVEENFTYQEEKQQTLFNLDLKLF